MSVVLKRFGNQVSITARSEALSIEGTPSIDWSRPESWAPEARESGSGRRTAFETASLLEMGIASVKDGRVEIPYSSFPEIEAEEFRLTTAFATPSPFLLKI